MLAVSEMIGNVFCSYILDLMLIYFTHVNDFQVFEKFTYTTVIIFLKTCKQCQKTKLILKFIKQAYL